MNKPFPQSRVGRVNFTLIALLMILVPLTVTAAPFEPDDIFLGAVDGEIYHYRNGNLVHVLNTGAGPNTPVRGLCFTTNGNYLYATSFGANSGRVSRFDNQGGLLDSIWGPRLAYTFDRVPVSCVVDAFGNVYVGDAVMGTESPNITKYGPDGSVLASFHPETNENSYQAIDLGSDQCTLIYTSRGKVKRFDVCNNRQLADLGDFSDLPPGGRTCEAVRIRKNGEVMVACWDILRLRSNGEIIRGYSYREHQPDRDHPARFFAVNLAPDGRTFWTASPQNLNLGRVYRIDIETGELVTFFDVERGFSRGVAVYREPTAATSECSDGIDNDDDGQIDYPEDSRCTSPEDVSELRSCWKVRAWWMCIMYLNIAAAAAALLAGAGIAWYFRQRQERI